MLTQTIACMCGACAPSCPRFGAPGMQVGQLGLGSGAFWNILDVRVGPPGTLNRIIFTVSALSRKAIKIVHKVSSSDEPQIGMGFGMGSKDYSNHSFASLLLPKTHYMFVI
jgi:hypothetical protein